MRTISVLSKSYSSAWQNISNWTNEVPYLPPYGLADVALEYVNYAYYAAPGGGNRTVRIAGATGGLPADWGAAVGVTLLITLPADWQQEGFEMGGGLIIYVEQSPMAWGYYSATILALNNQTATVRVDAIIAQSMPPPALDREEDTIIFLQDFASADVAAIVVRDGEENAFSSALNTNSIFTPHPDRALILSSAVVGTFAVSTPLWASNAAITIQRRSVTLRIGHFWPLQDGANLAAQAPQGLYPNRLWLLFGSSEQHFIKIQLSTSQLNLYENNSVITQAVTIAGDNTAGYTPTAPGSAAAFVALHNRTLAHQSAAADVQALLQSKPSGTFTFIPPSPQAVAVGVYYSATAGWGARVSEAVAIVGVDEEVIFGVYGITPQLRPWDVVGFGFRHKTIQVEDFLRVRWWMEYMLNNRYELIDSDELDIIPPFSPPNDQRDTRLLFMFPVLQGGSQTQTNIFCTILYFQKTVFPLLYNRKNLHINNVQVRFGVYVEHTAGSFSASTTDNVDLLPFTSLATWTDLGSVIRCTLPALPATNPLDEYSAYYRAAIFENDISETPISQSDNQHHIFNTAPLWQSAGTPYTFFADFPKPTQPGVYKFYLRCKVFFLNDNTATTTEVLDAAEVYTLTIPPSLPPAPTGEADCTPCVPVLPSETVPLLFPEPPKDPAGNVLPHTPAGDWYQLQGAAGMCFEKYHCALAEAKTISASFVDVLMHFDNRVWGRSVVGTSLLRAHGMLERIADEYSVERYVRKDYNEDDILRSYRRRYRLVLFITAPCALWHAELIKFAQRVDVTQRVGLVREVKDLVAEEFDIADLRSAYKITITLRERIFRHEARY